MSDFIPNTDAEFAAFATQLVSVVVGNPAAYGETVASLAPLTAANAAWNIAWPNHVNAQSLATAAQQTKVEKRGDLEEAIRALNGRVQANQTVTDSARSQARLPVHATGGSPLPPPTTAPLLQVDTSQRLRHLVTFRDAANPNRRGKPHGVDGCRLHVKIGSPPAGLADATFVAVDTASPYLMEFDPADAGKTAYWIACWINPRQQNGPCSETVAATIPG